MARAVFALALIGLSVVHALPAGLQGRQLLGSGSTTLTPGSNEGSTPCLSGASDGIDQGPCFLSPAISSGVHPSSKRQGSGQDAEQAIAELERQLLALQSIPDPTDDDLAQIAALEALILYTEGISGITAPPGVNTTLTHSRKRFTLPPDADQNVNKAIDDIEKQLEALQNKRNKTDDDLDEIEDLKAALKYLAGISQISAPPGTTTTLHPGKRQSSPPTLGSDACKLAEKAGVRSSLIALIQGYGGPDTAPPDVAKLEKQFISILEACGMWSGGDGGGGIVPSN